VAHGAEDDVQQPVVNDAEQGPVDGEDQDPGINMKLSDEEAADLFDYYVTTAR